MPANNVKLFACNIFVWLYCYIYSRSGFFSKNIEPQVMRHAPSLVSDSSLFNQSIIPIRIRISFHASSSGMMERFINHIYEGWCSYTHVPIPAWNWCSAIIFLQLVPRSSNSCNFWLWEYLKDYAYCDPITSISVIIINISHYARGIPRYILLLNLNMRFSAVRR